MGPRDTKMALLKLHVREYYEEPRRLPPARKRIARKIWRVKVYQRWAAEEMIEYLEKSKCDDLCYAAEEFAKMMDEFACKEHKDKQIFSIAFDVATELASYLSEL